MNKYQEALEAMCKRCSNNFICKGTGCQPKNDLQELVEKATPKKPNQTVYNAFCPNCKQALGREFAIDGIHGIICRQYCPNCGQALKWSESE